LHARCHAQPGIPPGARRAASCKLRVCPIGVRAVCMLRLV
jgi:hypothetical protein